jgi:CubicO group peptidase (beta-lactamase class C family)
MEADDRNERPGETGMAALEQVGLSRRAMLRRALGAAVAGALAPAPSFARSARRYAALEALLDDYVQKGRMPGGVVAVVRPGRFRPDYVLAGRSAFAGGSPVAADTLWRIYSMTKPVTGLAVMQEVGLGRLGLDTPLAELVPEFARMKVLVEPDAGLEARPAEAPIRVRHLLTHTAGFSYHFAGDGPLEQEYRRQGLIPIGNLGLGLSPIDGPVPDLDGFLRRLAALPLRAEPGSAYRYSVSLDVAGGMLERMHRKPFDRLLEERLLAPLGMRDTGFVVPAAANGRLSALYAWTDPATNKPTGRPELADAPPDTAWGKPPPLPAGGAGLVSSAADFARFAQMLLNEGMFEGRRLLPAGAARLAMSNIMPAALRFNERNGYGAGGAVSLVDTRADGPEGQPPGVFGWGGAAGTLFQVDPVRQVGVVLMLQFLPAQTFPMGRDFQAAINRDFG